MTAANCAISDKMDRLISLGVSNKTEAFKQKIVDLNKTNWILVLLVSSGISILSAESKKYRRRLPQSGCD